MGDFSRKEPRVRSSFPPAADQTNSIMVTRHRRRGHNARYTGDVGEPETKAHLRAEPKFESSPLQQTVPSLSRFRLRSWKSPGFAPVWQRGQAVRSAETRKVQQHRAEERSCLCRVIFQYRSVAVAVRAGGGAAAKRGCAARDLIETVETLRMRGIGFRSLTEALDTTTAQGRLVFHMFGALAEFERSLIRERTQAGLAAARRAGRTGGRPPKLTDDDIEAAKAMLANPDIGVTQIAHRLGVSPATLYRYIPAAQPRIRRAFDNGRSTPKTGRPRRVSA